MASAACVLQTALLLHLVSSCIPGVTAAGRSLSCPPPITHPRVGTTKTSYTHGHVNCYVFALCPLRSWPRSLWPRSLALLPGLEYVCTAVGACLTATQRCPCCHLTWVAFGRVQVPTKCAWPCTHVASCHVHLWFHATVTVVAGFLLHALPRSVENGRARLRSRGNRWAARTCCGIL